MNNNSILKTVVCNFTISDWKYVKTLSQIIDQNPTCKYVSIDGVPTILIPIVNNIPDKFLGIRVSENGFHIDKLYKSISEDDLSELKDYDICETLFAMLHTITIPWNNTVKYINPQSATSIEILKLN